MSPPENPDPICPCHSWYNFTCTCTEDQIAAFKAGREFEAGRRRKHSAAWKALAKRLADKLRRVPTRGELRHIGWLRAQRDRARAELEDLQRGGER